MNKNRNPHQVITHTHYFEGYDAGRRDRRLCETLADIRHYASVAVANLDPGPYRTGYLTGLNEGKV